MTYERYGQWWSYVLQIREGLAHAEKHLPTAQTEAARQAHQARIERCRAILSEFEAQFPETADAGPPQG